MPIAYFEIMGVLFLFYGFFRVIWWWEHRHYHWLPPSKPYLGPVGTPIDTSVLSERLENVRKNHQAEPRVRSGDFKRPLLLQQKREEVSRLAFFQKPPPPEPPEEGHGLNLLLV